MNRRKFLGTLGTLASAAALPPEAISRWEESGVIENEVFYLSETLRPVLPDGFVIRNCTFIAEPGLVGTALDLSECGPNGLVTDCYIDCTRQKDRTAYFIADLPPIIAVRV